MASLRVATIFLLELLLFANLPAWVTALFVLAAIAAVIVLFGLTASHIGKVIAKAITTGLLNGRRAELAELNREIRDAETILKEARAITQTAAAFEIDEELPVKMRQALSSLRVAQLQHAYDSLLGGLKASYKKLADARQHQAGATGQMVRHYADIVKHLNGIIAEQEQQVRELEPLLDEWGVAHKRLATKLHAV